MEERGRQQRVGTLATKLVAEACRRHGIAPRQLTLHADPGAAMRSKPLVALLAQLDVERTHSRPHVSNDNPFIESHFKTLKYDHHHSALAWMTHGRAQALLDRRAHVLADARAAHPERFPHGPPAAPTLPGAVWINPPKADRVAAPEPELGTTLILPTRPAPIPTSTLVSLR